MADPRRVEQFLVAAVQAGEMLDVSVLEDRLIRPWVIRDLLRGELTSNPDPRGVRVRGAVIEGELDLTDLRTALPLVLLSCVIDSAILVRAHLPYCDLSGSSVGMIRAEGLRCEHDLALAQVRCEHGVELMDAHIGGALDLGGAHLSNDEDPALYAARVTINGGAFLNEQFRAESFSPTGVIRLVDANIGGQLNLGSAHLINPQGPALVADGVTINGDTHLDEQFHAEAFGSSGAIRLTGATITGSLSFKSAQLSNSQGSALVAVRLTVNGGAFLDEQFRAEAAGTQGAVRLIGASVGGEFSLSSAHLSNRKGPGLVADGVTINSGAFLDEQFRAEGSSPLGAVRIRGAIVTGQLSLKGAYLSNSHGPALVADGVTINGDMFLDEQFCAEGSSSQAAVLLRGATITGPLVIRDATMCNQHHDRLCLDLVGTKVGGNFALSLSVLGTNDQPGRIDLDGLRYLSIPWSASLNEWLTLLRDRTSNYAAQPYQQLAAVHRAAGHEHDARRVLIAQQRDLRRRGELGGWLRRGLHIASGALISYGYRPWRALAFLLAVLGLAISLAISADAHQLSAHPKAAGGGNCSLVESLGLGADIAVPLLSTGGKQRCEIITATTAGQWHLGAAYVLQVLGWAFATLFVAGYTGLVRKP